MRLELIVLATISGAALQLNWLAASDAQVSIGGVILQVLIGIVLMLFIFFALYAIGNFFVKRLPLSHDAKTRYSRYSSYTFGVFLLFLLGIWGLEFSKFPLALVVFIWLIAQLFLVIFLIETDSSEAMPPPVRWISIMFLLSGGAVGDVPGDSFDHFGLSKRGRPQQFGSLGISKALTEPFSKFSPISTSE